MSKVSRRSFLEKAGLTLAAASVSVEADAAAGEAKKSAGGGSGGFNDPARNGIAGCVAEWSYSSGKPYADPFNDVELDVIFTGPAGEEQRVPAFWAGEQSWR